jgi:hypothetical protein
MTPRQDGDSRNAELMKRLREAEQRRREIEAQEAAAKKAFADRQGRDGQK